MRRILISQNEAAWSYSTPELESTEYASALDAADAARVYGETLRGTALGYVIRLQIAIADDEHLITLHTQVF